MTHWSEDAVFYHIYPLGYCGAPRTNDFASPPVPRLDEITRRIDEIADLGCTAVYLGPLFESSTHGYDTADYRTVDRRLGDRDDLVRLVEGFHAAGIRVVLDGVFHHVGRDFGPFQALRTGGTAGPYVDWFRGVDFGRNNRFGDGFAYDDWEGHDDLVALNPGCPDLRTHLFDAVAWMIDDLGIDGLRLDVAYAMDRRFLSDLAGFCRSKRADFWLMGEMIHGDYREIAGPDLLDSATNYEAYKGLYSSLNDVNYHEIAWSLNRQFGRDGLYRDRNLYNFVDNHDVDRAASILDDPEHLVPLYALLFTMPGIPSVYAGSEWRAEGRRTPRDDSALRPPAASVPRTDDGLRRQIRLLTKLRRNHEALRRGDYRQLHVSHEQLVFERRSPGERLVIALNAGPDGAAVKIPDAPLLVNVLDPDEAVEAGEALPIPRRGWSIWESGDSPFASSQSSG